MVNSNAGGEYNTRGSPGNSFCNRTYSGNLQRNHQYYLPSIVSDPGFCHLHGYAPTRHLGESKRNPVLLSDRPGRAHADYSECFDWNGFDSDQCSGVYFQLRPELACRYPERPTRGHAGQSFGGRQRRWDRPKCYLQRNDYHHRARRHEFAANGSCYSYRQHESAAHHHTCRACSFFAYQVGGAVPASQNLGISSTSTPLSFTASSNQPWLTVTPSGTWQRLIPP